MSEFLILYEKNAYIILYSINIHIQLMMSNYANNANMPICAYTANGVYTCNNTPTIVEGFAAKKKKTTKKKTVKPKATKPPETSVVATDAYMMICQCGSVTPSGATPSINPTSSSVFIIDKLQPGEPLYYTYRTNGAPINPCVCHVSRQPITLNKTSMAYLKKTNLANMSGVDISGNPYPQQNTILI